MCTSTPTVRLNLCPQVTQHIDPGPIVPEVFVMKMNRRRIRGYSEHKYPSPSFSSSPVLACGCFTLYTPLRAISDITVFLNTF